MAELAKKECVPCRGGVPRLSGEALLRLERELRGGWKVVAEHHLEKTFSFSDFNGAWQFVNRIGALAEEQDHHPEIAFSWGWVKITLWTHKIDGLTESDFIWAAKADERVDVDR